MLPTLSFLLFTLIHFSVIAATEVVDFEEVAKAFANEEARLCGTKIRFVDLYAKRPEMAQYQNKKIDVKFENMVYSTELRKIDKPSNVYSEDFNNGQSVDIKAEFSRKVDLKKSFTWKVTAKVSVQTKLEAKVSVPKVVEASGSITTTLEMTGETGKTEESTESVEKKHTLTIPKKTRVEVTLVITEQEMDIPWVADIVISGFFAFWLEKECAKNADPKDKHHLWFPSVSSLTSNRNFKWDPKRGLVYKTKGTFRSVRGMRASLNVEEYDYDPKNKLVKKSGKQKPRKSYIVPLP